MTKASQMTASQPDPIETASRDEIAALQTRRIKRTLQLVYDNVPAYRAKFEAAGVAPADFVHLDDLKKFPFTVKQDLRDAYPYGLLAVPRERIVRVHASSGTTGQPTVVGYTRRDLDVWADVVARCLRTAGGRSGMTVHIAVGYGLFTGGLGFHYGAERFGCTVVPAAAGVTERQVQLILDLRPDIIIPTPSYMLVILDEFRRRGLDPRQCSLKLAICGAEPWSDEMRLEIEQAFAIDAIDAYGLSEIIGPGVAIESIEAKGRGMYVWEDHFYPEIVDPGTGEVLADGHNGEIVFTSLTKEGMPMVRYRTRDLTRLMPGDALSMRRMDKVAGRSDDMMIVRGVNIFPTAIETQILRCQGLAPHYIIELFRRGRMDGLRVLVEAREDFAGGEARSRAAADLKGHIRGAIGIGIEVDVVDPGSIERSAGKAKRVRDLRPAG